MPRLSLTLPELSDVETESNRSTDGTEPLGSQPLMERWIGCWAESTDR